MQALGGGVVELRGLWRARRAMQRRQSRAIGSMPQEGPRFRGLGSVQRLSSLALCRARARALCSRIVGAARTRWRGPPPSDAASASNSASHPTSAPARGEVDTGPETPDTLGLGAHGRNPLLAIMPRWLRAAAPCTCAGADPQAATHNELRAQRLCNAGSRNAATVPRPDRRSNPIPCTPRPTNCSHAMPTRQRQCKTSGVRT